MRTGSITFMICGVLLGAGATPVSADPIVLDSQVSFYTTVFDDLDFTNQETFYDTTAEGEGNIGDTLSGVLNFVGSNITSPFVETPATLTFASEGVFATGPPFPTNNFSFSSAPVVAPPAPVAFELQADADGRGGLFFAYTSPDFYTLGTLGGFHALTFSHTLDVLVPLGSYFAFTIQIVGWDFSESGIAPGSHLFDPASLAGWTIDKNFAFELGATVLSVHTDQFSTAPTLAFTLIGAEAPTVPEPASLFMIGTGLAAAFMRRRRRT